MKTLKILAVLSVVALAALAITTNPIGNIDETARWLKGGAYISTGAAFNANNQIHNVLAGSLDFDYAALTASAGCIAASNTATVTGATLADPCLVSVDEQAADAGTVAYKCNVTAANTVTVWACPVGLNANPLDAGHNIWVISNQ